MLLSEVVVRCSFAYFKENTAYICKLAVSESENFSVVGVIVRKIEGKRNDYCCWVLFAEARE
jgi:hypothetical protein